jgi:enolase
METRETIEKIEAREILGGSGRPAVEVKLTTSRGIEVRASAPSGTSKGEHEAFELLDGEKRYEGKGVRRAVENVRKIIAPALRGMDVSRQGEIDEALIRLDGTPDKSRLGGNAILPVSMACAKAAARSCGLPLFRYLGGLSATHLPAPIATVIAGGAHSPSDLEFEDYLLILSNFNSFAEALEALVKARSVLQEIVIRRFGSVPEVGGALAPPIRDSAQAFELMRKAAEGIGGGGKITLGIDAAASELYSPEEDSYQVAGRKMKAPELMEYYLHLARTYPLTYLEDPFHEDDYFHFAALTAALPDCRIVGDDLFASQPRRIALGIQHKAGNTLLLKINQIGTVGEALAAASLASRNHFQVNVSLRSNETNDSFIADLAVAVRARQIKLGSPVRGERNAKYNRLLEIEEDWGLGDGIGQFCQTP